MPEYTKVKIINPDGTNQTVWTLKGKNIWEVLELAGMNFAGACGGRGTCGKCKVRIKGEVSELSPTEREHLLPEEFKRGERLACYCTVNGPAEVYLDYSLTNYGNKPFLAAECPEPDYKPEIKVREIFIAGKERNFPSPIMERLRNVLPSCRWELSGANLNELSRMDRIGRPTMELYALVFNDEVVKRVAKTREPVYGLALDLGTTSLFGALINMETGQVVNMSSHTNMQRIYGDDILSRVSYCLENEDGLGKMQLIMINNINAMVEGLLKDTHGSSNNIYKVTVVGNPVMLHFFMGLDVGGFAVSPYTGVFLSEMSYPAFKLGLNVNCDAQVLILPQIGGFVGADTVACLLPVACKTNSRYLLIDIGTNGEIVVYNRGKIWAGSAAAGPAFEGGGISCGMRALVGAVDKVWLDDKKLNFHVIGDGLVKGICGSAIIDLTASILEAGCLDKTGQLREDPTKRINVISEEKDNRLILTAEAVSGKVVSFNQDDVRQVQLAKAAIRTGIDILLKEAKLTCSDLDYIFLAGAFGHYLDPRNSMAIGLIPPAAINKIISIGNAAANGAILALKFTAKRTEARRLRDTAQLVELANYPGFQEMFIKNMDF